MSEPTASREDLFAAIKQAGEETVPYDLHLGERVLTVQLRQLSKAEQNRIMKRTGTNPDGTTKDVALFHAELFLAGIAEPELTSDDVAQLFDMGAGPYDMTIVKIMEISGMMEAREALQRRFPDLATGRT